MMINIKAVNSMLKTEEEKIAYFELFKNCSDSCVIENVKDLGLFLEVEYCTDIDGDVKMEKKIQEFINSLGINVSEELNIGKPEMYMKKHNIEIK